MGDRATGEEQEDSGEGEEEDVEGKLHIVGEELRENETNQKRDDHSNNRDRCETDRSDRVKIDNQGRHTDREEAVGQLDKPSVEHSNEDIAVSIPFTVWHEPF